MSGAKCRITLKIHISVINKKKLNDLQKSIVTGPFYVHSKFDMLSSLVSGEMWNPNPLGWTFVTMAWRAPKLVFTERTDV